MNIEKIIEKISAKELEKIIEGFNQKQQKIPIYQYSKIRESDLDKIINIKKNLDNHLLKPWMNNDVSISEGTVKLLKKLIQETEKLIEDYWEEDLKMKFLSTLFQAINFQSYHYEFRDFYELKLEYKTDKFILSGIPDFVLSKGLVKSEQVYFFIQEFKKSIEFSYPKPQLLAELVSGVELNNWRLIKGAYIVGSIWHFVILEKLGKDTYQYSVSRNFDCTRIDDLKAIYKNLVFVKNEVIALIKQEQAEKLKLT